MGFLLLFVNNIMYICDTIAQEMKHLIECMNNENHSEAREIIESIKKYRNIMKEHNGEIFDSAHHTLAIGHRWHKRDL